MQAQPSERDGPTRPFSLAARLARLEKGEVIDKLLYGGYSTISLGYAGLYECCKYMTGKSHTDPSVTPFAMQVMQHMNDACAKWKAEHNIDFSLYGTPLESTTYKFSKCLQKRFGMIEGSRIKAILQTATMSMCRRRLMHLQNCSLRASSKNFLRAERSVMWKFPICRIIWKP